MLEADPAHSWTVEALAAEAGVSRAALARRFTALVGQPPMSYLRERRIALATELLRRPEATLAAVAGRVGFSSAFALSVACKKARGMSQSDLLHELAAGHPFALSEPIKPRSPTSRTSRRTGGS
ncbi:helix-turn-helix transcriptional regulator [Streptomyces sp. NPDC086835]|uniref:helix-turn-helix transcriptional regulator n=1 Tax=Streptomyces sp. NPDC086835 TaxID=3365761 RepID=UPI0037F6A722